MLNECHWHIRLVEESKNWVLSPARKASKKEREYAAKRLDSVIAKIKNAMQSAVQKIQNKLMQPKKSIVFKDGIAPYFPNR